MSEAVGDAADAGPGRRDLGLVLLGGMAGTALRLALAGSLEPVWATLLANLAGALLLGLLVERLREHRLRRTGTWSLLGPGLCGALTTFSALQLEAVELARDGAWVAAGGVLVGTVALGLPLAALGGRLGRARA